MKYNEIEVLTKKSIIYFNLLRHALTLLKCSQTDRQNMCIYRTVITSVLHYSFSLICSLVLDMPLMHF